MSIYAATAYSLTSANHLWATALSLEWEEHQPNTLNLDDIPVQHVSNAPDAKPSGVIYTNKWGRIEGWVNGLSAYIVSET